MKPTHFLAIATMLTAAPFLHAQNPPAATPVPHPIPSIQDTETPAAKDARMEWWRQARFGMFIHWGLYSVPAGTWDGKQIPSLGEWIMNNASIPVADYKALAAQFNPTGFGAHDIVALAKSAGMKYIVITAKHHDGFAMFDSKANAFNIVAATPFHRDPLKELAEECRKQGLKLGFYYSQDQDWTAPGGSAILRQNHDPVTHHWDKAQDGDFDTYLHTKAIPQIKELLSNYGDFPAVLWFDTPTANMTPARAAEIVALVNQHPDLIWNNRLGGGYKGDTETPEQTIPAQGFPGRDWESCMTINDTWGYKSYDTNFKSTETLLRNLIDIASKGGNYLLNIGPDSHGIVPQPEVDRLHAMGAWLAGNGEAIYGTTPTLFGAEAGSFSATEKDRRGNPLWVPAWNWRSTTRPDKIYIEVFNWPKKDGIFVLPNLPRTVSRAYLLADPAHKPLLIYPLAGGPVPNQVVANALSSLGSAAVPAGNGLLIQLPAAAPDPIATVVVLETAK
jgi:alpha-L-fucosidase